ncbi:MFS transporter, partial [Acetobacter oeni]|uniref:MFS transporter n=3 Tax=Acetobacter oeni TaxID=304077 RepID=UPI00160615BA
ASLQQTHRHSSYPESWLPTDSELNTKCNCSASGALVTVLAYAGSFAAYTYIEPLLIERASISIGAVSGFMLGYGVAAAVGNVAGGRMTDGLGIAKANMLITSGISVVVLGIFWFCDSPTLMFGLVAALGFLSYAAVPALQARLLNLAERFVPHAHGVAAGLNIAGFNSGIALGSVIGGVTIRWFGISYVGLVAFVISGFAFLFLAFQERGKL